MKLPVFLLVAFAVVGVVKADYCGIGEPLCSTNETGYVDYAYWDYRFG